MQSDSGDWRRVSRPSWRRTGWTRRSSRPTPRVPPRLGGWCLWADGVDYLVRDIQPAIRQACPSATLPLVGRTPAEDRLRYVRGPAVACLGFAPDIQPHVAEACCRVVPSRVGGGTRLKILDAWAMGKAVVSTSLGCEGLDAVDGDNILVRDDPGEFARAVVDVLSNTGLRNKLEFNARKTAEQRYSWDLIGARLRGAYHEIMSRLGRASSVCAPLDRVVGGTGSTGVSL